MSVFGERIRAARTDAGLTQSKLAAACGVQVLSVSQWERRGTIPSAEHLARVAEVTGADPGWLLTGKAPSAECPAWVQDVKAWARATLDWAEQVEGSASVKQATPERLAERKAPRMLLRELRTMAGFSQEALGHATGLTGKTICRIENGEPVGKKAAVALAAFFDKDIRCFTDGWAPEGAA